MSIEKFIELQDLLRRYRTIQRNVPDGHLRRALKLADEAGDHWARTQVTRWVASAREYQADWFQLPFQWLVHAAERRSPWTVDLARYIISGCPMAMVRSDFLTAAEKHPGAIATALNEMLSNGSITPLEIPDLLIDRLITHAPQAGGNAPGVVAHLLARVRPENTNWAHRISSWLHRDELRYSRVDIMEALLEGWPGVFPSLAAIR